MLTHISRHIPPHRNTVHKNSQYLVTFNFSDISPNKLLLTSFVNKDIASSKLVVILDIMQKHVQEENNSRNYHCRRISTVLCQVPVVIVRKHLISVRQNVENKVIPQIRTKRVTVVTHAFVVTCYDDSN